MKLVENFFEVGEAITRGFEKYNDRLSHACTRGMKNVAQGLKYALRKQVTDAGLGQKLANTWRSNTYPKAGSSLDAACLVYSKAPEIIMAFDASTTIRSKHGTFLCIPTEEVPKGPGGRRLTPSTWPAEQLGKLYFVGGRGGPSVLIVHGWRARTSIANITSRKFAKASDSWKNRGKELRDVVMFILVPQVSLTRRLNVRDEASKWASQAAALIDQEMGNG